MNDPVLNRKLFRHQAQIIHKQIPKYQYGGGIPANPWSLQGLSQSFASSQAAAQKHFQGAITLANRVGESWEFPLQKTT